MTELGASLFSKVPTVHIIKILFYAKEDFTYYTILFYVKERISWYRLVSGNTLPVATQVHFFILGSVGKPNYGSSHWALAPRAVVVAKPFRNE